PAMVVSLWQVNDDATARIMKDFYQHLAEGMSKVAALRQAKLNYINSSGRTVAKHPAFWSPFIQVGDHRPIKVSQKHQYTWLWWLLGGGIAVLVLVFGWRFMKSREIV
ncbi:MAG: CHAT domain-containing protein, partial [Saprospiraceae bacterium]|nr:CHAT domain-containing protein [Saprospiraceae bacterium]